MAEGIKDKVAIIGMGCTKFGERWDAGSEDLIVEAFQEAMEDAGIEKKEIQAAWYGSCFDEVNVGKAATPLSLALKLPFLPVTRVENFCATGSEALRGATYAVASGAIKETGHISTGDISAKDNADIFLIISLGRLVNLLDGIIVLLSNGLVYEAQIIARTIFELICQALITYDDPEFLNEIENHDLVMEKRSLELWLGNKPHLLDPKMNDEKRAQEEQRYF